MDEFLSESVVTLALQRLHLFEKRVFTLPEKKRTQRSLPPTFILALP